MKEIHVGDRVTVDVKPSKDLEWSDGKKRVAFTRNEFDAAMILVLGDHSRRQVADRFFGEETDG